LLGIAMVFMVFEEILQHFVENCSACEDLIKNSFIEDVAKQVYIKIMVL
jgi:hypothetical protein